jgi:hypothetical protein
MPPSPPTEPPDPATMTPAELCDRLEVRVPVPRRDAEKLRRMDRDSSPSRRAVSPLGMSLRLQLKSLFSPCAAYLHALPPHQGDEGSLGRAVGS